MREEGESLIHKIFLGVIVRDFRSFAETRKLYTMFFFIDCRRYIFAAGVETVEIPTLDERKLFALNANRVL